MLILAGFAGKASIKKNTGNRRKKLYELVIN
jgi:hypothetical protein